MFVKTVCKITKNLLISDILSLNLNFQHFVKKSRMPRHVSFPYTMMKVDTHCAENAICIHMYTYTICTQKHTKDLINASHVRGCTPLFFPEIVSPLIPSIATLRFQRNNCDSSGFPSARMPSEHVALSHIKAFRVLATVLGV